MELLHSKHRQMYVNNLNDALKLYSSTISAIDLPSQVDRQSATKFNGGEHINHSLFWGNLSPASSSDAKPDRAPTSMAAISKTWGSLDEIKAAMGKTLLGQ